MYDAKIARFMQEDTYRGSANDPLSLNLYSYCHNEPMMYTDPTGHANVNVPGLGMVDTNTNKVSTPKVTTPKLVLPPVLAKMMTPVAPKTTTPAAPRTTILAPTKLTTPEASKPTKPVTPAPVPTPKAVNEIVSQDDINAFVNQYNKKNDVDLTATQIQALNKINSYASNDKIKNNGNNPQVFFFEGAGNDKKVGLNVGNKEKPVIEEGNYPKGRYSAMAVVVKNGKITFMSLNASTLPDNPQNGSKYNDDYPVATTLEGVYIFNQTQHGSNEYPALALQSDVGVIRYNSSEGNYTKYTEEDTEPFLASDGIHIHKGATNNDSLTLPSSTGCLTILPSDYNKFAVAVGFDIDGNVQNHEGPDVVSGVVIVDRSLMDTNRSDLQKLYGTQGLDYINDPDRRK